MSVFQISALINTFKSIPALQDYLLIAEWLSNSVIIKSGTEKLNSNH